MSVMSVYLPPSLGFSLFLITLYDPLLLTLESFLHIKLHTIFISNVSAIEIISPHGSVSTQD